MSHPSSYTCKCVFPALVLFWVGLVQPAFAQPFSKLDVVELEEIQGCTLAWGDYDNDGDPDLAITNDWSDGMVKLLRNDGFEEFVEIALPSTGRMGNLHATARGDFIGGFGIAWGDYDNDGDLDLIVAQADSPCRLLRNEGSDLFVEGQRFPPES
ncbi:MAG: VCBS repeat-containing protein, partial [Planctomycetota bacterium]